MSFLDNKKSFSPEGGVHFVSTVQERVFRTVLHGLESIGYRRDALLKEEYRFNDWFAPNTPLRIAPAAAFGQTPHSYDTACFSVLLPNGKTGRDLVSDFRALGSP